MRAIELRPVHAAWLLGLPAVACLAACPDSLHLTLGSGGTSSSSSERSSASASTSGTSSSGSGTGCHSNPDCTYPTPVCDAVSGKCVECLLAEDCGDPTVTVCSAGKCVCPNPPEAGTGDQFCADPNGGPGHCADLGSSPTDCGACGHACYGACTGGGCSSKWSPTTTVGAPAARTHHVAVSTGTKMIVWGGMTGGGLTDTGGIYDPATNTWTPTSQVDAPDPRQDATAVWDDVENVMIVWGGLGASSALDTGGRFDPVTNTWTPMSTIGAPSPRSEHSAVWANPLGFMSAAHGMIVWGGYTDPTMVDGDGGVYDPVADQWLGPIDNAGAEPRGQHTAVWAGNPGPNQMFVFGGAGLDAMDKTIYLNDGFAFLPAAPSSMLTGVLPPARAQHTAVWDGTEMIVFGGTDGAPLADAYSYDGTNWATIPPSTDPTFAGALNATAVWVPAPVSEMILFGGDQGPGKLLVNAWSLDKTMMTWTALPSGPERRSHHTAVVIGTKMVVWGGDGADGPLASGGVFDAGP